MDRVTQQFIIKLEALLKELKAGIPFDMHRHPDLIMLMVGQNGKPSTINKTDLNGLMVQAMNLFEDSSLQQLAINYVAVYREMQARPKNLCRPGLKI